MIDLYTYGNADKEENGGWAWYDAYMRRTGLSRLKSRMLACRNGDSINVGYFGGSITNGSGLVGSGSPWRILVGEYLTDSVKQLHSGKTVVNQVIYPSQHNFHVCSQDAITVKNINAGIGATGSFFGVHRLEKMLGIDKGLTPDLVFIEFAVNDYWDKREYTAGGKAVLAAAADFEAIIRKLYRANPKVCIIAVFTNLLFTEDYIDFSNNPALAAQRAVLRHYNIPYLYAGLAMYHACMRQLPPGAEKFTADNYTDAIHEKAWSTYYSDNCHPNAKGYRFYADMIIDYIKASISRESAAPPLPVDPLHPDGFLKMNAFYIDCAQLYENKESLLSGWHKTDYIDPNENPYLAVSQNGSIYSETENASLSFTFTGNSVGFWVARSLTGGVLTAKVYDIRGALVKNSQMLIGYDAHDGLAEPWDVASNLTYGKYAVKVWVKASTYGVSGCLRKLFINGSIDSVQPLAPPCLVEETSTTQKACRDVYVNAAGLVTMEDMTEYPACRTIAEAVNVCGGNGSLHIEGDFLLDYNGAVENITIQGIGKTDLKREKNVIIIQNPKLLKNIMFENVTLLPSSDINMAELKMHILNEVSIKRS